MRLTVVTLTNGIESRNLLVRNYNGVDAPAGNKHIARFMNKHNARVSHFYFSPVRETFEECFEVLRANHAI